MAVPDGCSTSPPRWILLPMCLADASLWPMQDVLWTTELISQYRPSFSVPFRTLPPGLCFPASDASPLGNICSRSVKGFGCPGVRTRRPVALRLPAYERGHMDGRYRYQLGISGGTIAPANRRTGQVVAMVPPGSTGVRRELVLWQSRRIARTHGPHQ